LAFVEILQMASLLFGCFIAMAMPMSTGASSGFLHPSPSQTLTPEKRSAVLAAIEEALGEKHRHATEVRLAPLAALLTPTLNALPKNEHGKFGHKAARYALHRLFVQRHAWFVKGINLNGDTTGGNATATDMLQDGVPDEIQTLFEMRLGSKGLDAHEVAVLAATFENLAHAESMERLRLAYKVKVSSEDMKSMPVNISDAVLDLYMAAYVAGLDLAKMGVGPNAEKRILRLADKIYPGFGDVKKFVRDVRKESTSNRDALSFVDLSHVATRIGDKYGRWQHYECDDLKRKLLALQDDGTGRVSLVKFYRGAVDHGHWQFGESPNYLRSQGVLDDSDPANPRVIVPNYLLAPGNCVASSSYYSVCCLDECEDLIDHLEREISAPAATPARIASLVVAMPSSTTPADRAIPARLLERLDEIAARNDGMVPLHGRSFAQWMHNVYPRECPYPHMSGTFNAKRSEVYQKETGDKSVFSKRDMEAHIADADETDAIGEIAWSDEDEFYVEQGPPRYASFWSMIRFVVFFIPALSTAFFVLRVGRAAGTETNWQALSKSHYV
jgi:hypothetical protein